ncbi:MAG: hypothetical protein K2W94_05105 [Alphaproteobacteria bacterium]|nr:hypothetical protein [Alphaproteobacteria bacterium]
MRFLKTVLLSTLLLTTSLQNLQAADKTPEGRRESLSRRPSMWASIGFGTTIDEETVKEQAKTIIGKEVFATVSDANKPGIRTQTTLNTLLTAHDELSALVANGLKLNKELSNGTAFKDTNDLFLTSRFTKLKQREKSLRIIINLIWGGFMIDTTADKAVATNPHLRSSHLLFQGKGFEGEQSSDFQSPGYSFYDDGNSATHVAQIRFIAEAMGIDCNALFYLPFDPNDNGTADTIASSFAGIIDENGPKGNTGFCVLDILKLRKSMSDADEADEMKSSSSATDSGMDAQSGALAELEMLRNQIKFDLLMDESVAKKLDKGKTRQLVLMIANRLQGSDVSVSSTRGDAGASSDKNSSGDLASPSRNPFAHSEFINMPFGTHLKPTTKAGYMAADSVLQSYWERTEAILASAEGIVSAEGALKAAPLDNRVSELFVRTLHVVHNYRKNNPDGHWSNLVTTMLGDSHLHVSRRGVATYVGDISELENLFPDTSTLSGSNAPQYLFNNQTEMTMYALEALVSEYKALQMQKSK